MSNSGEHARVVYKKINLFFSYRQRSIVFRQFKGAQTRPNNNSYEKGPQFGKLKGPNMTPIFIKRPQSGTPNVRIYIL